MSTYLTLSDLSNELGVYEFEITTTYPTGTDDAGFIVGDTLTGGTSTKTMIVLRKISPTKYFVGNLSGAPTLGESLTNGNDTATLLTSDAIALQTFLNRAQSIVELYTGKKLLNTGTSTTRRITTSRRKSVYKLSAGKLPVISITSITSNGNTYTGAENTGYILDRVAGLIEFIDGSQTFDATHRDNLLIVYTWGDASATVAGVDATHKEVVAQAATHIWERYNAVTTAPGATSINPGAFALQFKDKDLFTENYLKLLAIDSRILI